jgi:hypothetical protein
MLRHFAPLTLLTLLSFAPLKAQDNGLFFNASARVTISRAPFGPDLNFYGALRMRNLLYPVADPQYQAWWEVTIVPEDPDIATQLGVLSAQISAGHVSASGTPTGHMMLQFGSQLGAWQINITPLDATLRQHIAVAAQDLSLNGDVGVQVLTFMVGNDSMTITGIQLAGTQGQQFFWQRSRK